MSSLTLRLTSSPQQGSAGNIAPTRACQPACRAGIYKVNSFQFTRSARLILELPEEDKRRLSPRCKLRIFQAL